MNKIFLPKPIWDFYHSLPSLWHTEKAWDFEESQSLGLSISEDKEHIYFETALPGVSSDEIELRLDNGRLSIKGNRKERKNRDYHKKGNFSFDYSVAIPSYINEEKEPDATYRDGILTVKLCKSKKNK